MLCAGSIIRKTPPQAAAIVRSQKQGYWSGISQSALFTFVFRMPTGIAVFGKAEKPIIAAILCTACNETSTEALF
jgi:hypothetical protein